DSPQIEEIAAQIRSRCNLDKGQWNQFVAFILGNEFIRGEEPIVGRAVLIRVLGGGSNSTLIREPKNKGSDAVAAGANSAAAAFAATGASLADLSQPSVAHTQLLSDDETAPSSEPSSDKKPTAQQLG
ncbi:MAG: hypothetical protein ACRDL7_10950, partial [Gaiellaceae bacterium]